MHAWPVVLESHSISTYDIILIYIRRFCIKLIDLKTALELYYFDSNDLVFEYLHF